MNIERIATDAVKYNLCSVTEAVTIIACVEAIRNEMQFNEVFNKTFNSSYGILVNNTILNQKEEEKI